MPSRVSSKGKGKAGSGSSDPDSGGEYEAAKNRREGPRRDDEYRERRGRRDADRESEDRSRRRERRRNDDEDTARPARRNVGEEFGDNKSRGHRESGRRRGEDDDRKVDGAKGREREQPLESPRRPDRHRGERRRKENDSRRNRYRDGNSDEEEESKSDRAKKNRDKFRDSDEEDQRTADRAKKIGDKSVDSDEEDERKGDRAKNRDRGRDDSPHQKGRKREEEQHMDNVEKDNSSEEDGELVDKKDNRRYERLKRKQRERRSESPNRSNRYQEERTRMDNDGRKNRDKARDSDEDDEREGDRGKKRDKESSPPRGGRNREERHRRDNDLDSPRRKEKNGYDHSRRNREQEKTREKDVMEESKEEPVAAVQQMPDASVIRTGGIYIPPHRMAQMMRDVQDKSSEQYQRLSWDALRKSINGLVNKVNATNIKNIIPELFSENLIRGRGLFCRSCMKSQMASPRFTDVFAALVAVVNTKFPEVGKLLLKRIVLQLRRAYKRNDKPQLLAATKFIAHLVNQQVAHEIVALELLTLLLESPTDDSVEVAVGFVKECGALLQDFSPQGLHGIFERFRGILHEGEIDKRVQFLIEGLFAIRKAKFQGFPAIRPELDLVEQEDQFTHEVSLEDVIDPEIGLDIFKPNSRFLEDEKAYEDLKRSILGEESSDEGEGSDADADSGDEDDDESEEEEQEQMKIKDETETNLVNLRRTIYLTIMSSVDFEEAGHKLLKIKLEPGQEMELCIMLLECCSQERTYLRYYGLLGQRFCMINKVYQENFEKCFVQQYSMIHRLETNKLRNVAKFFAHLLGTDALPWHVLAYIRLTEEDTTSSSRIFIKILFQELSEHLGISLLNKRLNDPTMQDSFESIFPKDNPKNTRFSINFFTSIGLGGITETLREYLKNMPRLIMQQQKPVSESDDDSGSSASSSGSSSSESDSSSESESDSSSDESERNKRRNKRRRRN